MRKKAAPWPTERPDPSCSTATHHAVRVTLREGKRTLEWVRVEQHAWSDWEKVRESGCILEGLERRVCTVCGGTQNRRLAPQGHVVRRTAECDKTSGRPVMECTVCGMQFRNGRLILPQNNEEPEEEPEKRSGPGQGLGTEPAAREKSDK